MEGACVAKGIPSFVCDFRVQTVVDIAFYVVEPRTTPTIYSPVDRRVTLGSVSKFSISSFCVKEKPGESC